MSTFQERRHGQRVAIPGRPEGRVRAILDARLLDLSQTGVRIEHEHLMRPGFSCTLELPPAMDGLLFPVRVVRSVVIGTTEAPGGDRLLLYESGLAFADLTAAQQEALDALLARLTVGAPLGNGRLVL
jgi:hypothetical protein